MQRFQSRQRTDVRSYIEDDSDESDIEKWRRKDDWENASHGRTIFSGQQEDVHEALQVNGSRTPIGRSELGLLSRGDHIGWHRPYMIWHHAIVVDIDFRRRKVKVIHFTKVNGRSEFAEQWINIDKQKGDLFRFNYSAETVDQNPPDLVIQRARSRVGERGYKLFRKNCEHLATFCKTGAENSAQVRWAWGKVKETLHTSAGNVARAGTRLGCAVVREAGKQTAKSVAESTGKVAAAEAAERLAKASNWVGAGLVAGIEIAHGAYDIYHIRKNYKAGKMTQRDYRVTTTQRVSEGVLGGALAIGGSLFGEWIGGLAGAAIGSAFPVVGTAIGAFVGSVVFGALGSIAGKVLGSIFGNWFGKKLW